MEASSNSELRYLVFLWKATGYELRERKGEPPALGSELEEDEVRYHVDKLGTSPLPGDSRPCAYANPVR